MIKNRLCMALAATTCCIMLVFAAQAQVRHYPGSARYIPNMGYNAYTTYSARAAMIQAMEDYGNQDYLGAERNLDVYLKYFGGDDNALYFRGFCRYMNNNRKYALRDLRRAVAMNPRYNKDLYTLIGTIYSEKGRYKKAIRFLKKSLKYYPKEADTYNNLGKTYQMTGQHLLALKCYNQSIGLDSSNAIVFNNRGCVLNFRYEYVERAFTSDMEQAILDFDKAISMDSNLAVAYKNKAIAYYFEKKYNLALENINIAIAKSPHEYSAFFHRSRILGKMNRWDEAARDLDLCLQNDTVNLNAIRVEQGNMLLMQGSYDEAELFFKQLVKQVPGKTHLRSFLYYKIAQALAQAENRPEAMRYLHKAYATGYFKTESNAKRFVNDASFKSLAHDPKFNRFKSRAGKK